MKTNNRAQSTLPYQECSLEKPERCHFCQVHQHESSLTAAAIRYLQLGVVSGENLVMITSAERQEMILDWLGAAGVDVAELKRKQRIFIRQSQDVIDALFENGTPDWETFEGMATEVFDAATRAGETRVRFYGDAVSELWASGNHAGVIALEEFWARLKLKHEYNAAFFCGYVIDALSPQSYSRHLPHLGRPHSFVMPSRDSMALEGALDRAGNEILGIHLSHAAANDRAAPGEWRHRMPSVFESGIWLKKHHPAAVTRVLEQAKSIYTA